MIKPIQLQFRVGMLIALAVLSTFSLSLLPTAAGAVNNAPNTLKVSPVRSDITISQGGKRAVKVTVTNLTNQERFINPIENDFIAGDERGTPALILDEDEFAPTHSLKRFMKPLDDFTIPANQSRTIEVIIEVPKDAQAGGYFGAVRFAPSSPEDGGQVNLSASVASLILMTVPGDAVETLELTDFKIQQKGKTGTFFTAPDNIQVATRFRNDGNVQLGPFGKISVTKGDDVVYEADFNDNDPREMVLPDSSRRWEVPLKDLDDFGNYTVSAVFTYGSSNKTLEIKQSFWVVPVGVIIAVIGGIVALIALITATIFALRGYKKRILRNNSHRRRSGYSRR